MLSNFYNALLIGWLLVLVVLVLGAPFAHFYLQWTWWQAYAPALIWLAVAVILILLFIWLIHLSGAPG